eukprot:CAMPEP_0183349818 /NCGR_PEP_ID=MMETSP0164_2-20130417/13882_1 /TAXON_ID=221442 /ORGANISM="Coccolithus pelagicus ssp braarudi, Strain PLY182g" /LENGTH=213 /DNA_ID=CAMNT_0025521607 /DNA_START=20 /DNA_END=661 /DNA_ORIENTATION=-
MAHVLTPLLLMWAARSLREVGSGIVVTNEVLSPSSTWSPVLLRSLPALQDTWWPDSLARLPRRWAALQARSPQSREESEWLGHWQQESFETDKAEAVMRAERVPLLARKIAMRFKPERRFVLRDGNLVGSMKTLSGSWMEFSTTHETEAHSVGYDVHSVSHSEPGNVLCTVSTAKSRTGSTKVTTNRHYLEGDRLVCETTSSGGTYKVYFCKT